MWSARTQSRIDHYPTSDPAHTAIAPGGLSAKTPAMTPLMLDG
ncbi:TPA: head decoration protein, partial [Escherichia coli]